MARPTSLGAATLAGFAMWLAFPDVGIWPFAIGSLVLLQVAMRRDSGWRGVRWNALLGFLCGTVFFLPHLWWARAATETAPWLALALLLCAPWFAVFGALWTLTLRIPAVQRSPWARAVVFGTLWVGIEQWRSQTPWGGFPWARLAWAAAGAPPGRWAWLGGSVTVTFALALAAALLVAAGEHVRQGRPSKPKVWVALGSGLLLVFAPLALPLASDGTVRPALHPDRLAAIDVGLTTAQAGTLVAGLVQGNNENPGGDWATNAEQVLARHLAGTLALADMGARLDVVLWPEDSVGWNPETNPSIAERLTAAADSIGVPLLIGSQEFPQTGGRYNVMLLWAPTTGGEPPVSGGKIARYAKQRPVPFGEFMPMRGFLARLSDQVARVSTDMLAAQNPPIIALPVPRLGHEVPLGVGICFEVAYDQVFRDAVRSGAQVLVIPTNNASFGRTAQSTQQLAMTRLQAIATGRAAVQVSTVGVSGAVTPDGTVVARTGLFTEEHLVLALPLRTSITPAVRLGAAPAWLVSAASLILPTLGLAYGWRTTTRKDRPTDRRGMLA